MHIEQFGSELTAGIVRFPRAADTAGPGLGILGHRSLWASAAAHMLGGR